MRCFILPHGMREICEDVSQKDTCLLKVVAYILICNNRLGLAAHLELTNQFINCIPIVDIDIACSTIYYEKDRSIAFITLKYDHRLDSYNKT